MTPSCSLVCLTFLVAGVLAGKATPFQKVVELINDLKKEVENEGRDEMDSYEKFACFCQSTNGKKSSSIKKGNDNINELSADIADKTEKKNNDITELAQRKKDQEKLSSDLDEANARCAREKATYEAENADVSKAISSLKAAIKAMTDSKPGAASLLAIKSVVSSLSKTVAATKASVSMQKVAALLQQKVDPKDAEYDFHSNDIIELCDSLLVDFKDSKQTLDSEWGKTSKGCTETKGSLREEMRTNKKAMDELDEEIQKLGKEIAKHREDLVEAESLLKDDELYLKDLTARCEDRANDYDQRAQMRGQELQALEGALEVLTKEVKSADSEVNKRALFIQNSHVAPASEVKSPAHKNLRVTKVLKKALESYLDSPKARSMSFLQVEARSQNDLDLDLEAKKGRALSMLQSEGRRIGSVALASLVSRVAADPFKKVKGLIQKLIQRLLEESAAEATKKGFCDTALAKAEHDRDSRFNEARDLSRTLAGLEAKRDELTEEIKVLSNEIADEEKALKETTDIREDEKADNLKALKVAQDGMDGVTEALRILRSFYSSAAKAALIQASPVDEDTAGPGFSGNYKGKQGSMKAVFSLLEVIQSDFDRTIRNTQKAEDKAHREYTAFAQASKSSIAGKTTKKELDEEDLATTKTSLEEKMADLKGNVNLMDDAIKELENLKPQCIDTGMSYKERVEKREEEMKALRKALCILDTENVEAECKNR